MKKRKTAEYIEHQVLPSAPVVHENSSKDVAGISAAGAGEGHSAGDEADGGGGDAAAACRHTQHVRDSKQIHP